MDGKAIEVLLEHVIDYAGLFPPASLELEGAVTQYRKHLNGPESFLLGRFVLPASRVSQWLQRCQEQPPLHDWPLALVAKAPQDDLLAAVRQLQDHRVPLQAVEVAGATTELLQQLSVALPPGMEVFVELPWQDDPSAMDRWVAQVRHAGLAVKVRTGGLQPEAFPSPRQLAALIRTCHRLHVLWKATAGLHHAFTGRHPLAGSTAPETTVTMFGFINLLAATSLLWAGELLPSELEQVLEAPEEQFELSESRLRWRDRQCVLVDMAAARRRAMRSFGSCSIDEPVTELLHHGLWPDGRPTPAAAASPQREG